MPNTESAKKRMRQDAVKHSRNLWRKRQIKEQIKSFLTAVHDHNEVHQIGPLLERMRRGETVAVVTDAGMPGISDPGERLVRVCLDAGLRVELVPGPSATLSALVMLRVKRWAL